MVNHVLSINKISNANFRYYDVILFSVLFRENILFNIFNNSFYLVLKFCFGLADPNEIIKKMFSILKYLILFSSQQLSR